MEQVDLAKAFENSKHATNASNFWEPWLMCSFEPDHKIEPPLSDRNKEMTIAPDSVC